MSAHIFSHDVIDKIVNILSIGTVSLSAVVFVYKLLHKLLPSKIALPLTVVCIAALCLATINNWKSLYEFSVSIYKYVFIGSGDADHSKSKQYLSTEVRIDPLRKLNESGFKFDEDSFARSISTGRIDITSLFIDAGFDPLRPIKNTDPWRSITALHFALQKNTRNICALFDLFKDRGVDLASSKATGLGGPVTLMDIAIASRNVEAVTCLKPYFRDIKVYRDALRIKLSIIRLLDVRAPHDRLIVSSILGSDCFEKVKYLVGRLDVYMELAYSGAYNVSDRLYSGICYFRSVKYLKYMISNVHPEDWDGFEQAKFWAIQRGEAANDADKDLGANVSLRPVIERYEEMLDVLK